MPYSTEQYYQEKINGRRQPNGAVILRKLSGKHMRIVNMHIAGLKGKDIAAEMMMTEAQISIILNDPAARALMAQRFLDIDNELFAKSHEVVAGTLDSKDEALRLRAADMVWRARGKFEKKESDRPTAEDLVRRMLDVAERNGQASLTVTAGSIPEAVDPTLLIEGKAE